MRHGHRGGPDRHSLHPDHHHRHHGEHHGRGRHRGRPFDYGELRLLVLALVAERPRHGYELIKAIEERCGGAYSPSPGVIYPTLAWLEDMGYAAIEPESAGRKLCRITPEGEAFLVANRAAVDALLARIGTGAGAGEGGPDGHAPEPVVRAMKNLQLAVRLRLRRGGLDPDAAGRVAAALDAAAQAVEQS